MEIAPYSIDYNFAEGYNMPLFSRRDKNNGPAWPDGGDGKPIPAALLTTADTRAMEADIIVNMLRAHGFPAVTRLHGEGMIGMVFTGQPRLGVGIYVPETMLDDAAALLNDDGGDDNEYDTEVDET